MNFFIDIRIRTFFKIENADADADADVNFTADDPRMRMRMRMWRTSLILSHRKPFKALEYSDINLIFKP